METFPITTCEEETWISVGLFCDVSNAGGLRNEAASGNLEAVLLDPTLIVSSFHILAAANKALLAREQKQMKTRNVYSEIIFCLSPSTNISNSFKTFGVKDDSQSMLIVLIHNCRDGDKIYRTCDQVQGTLVALSNLAAIHQKEKIIKFYDISPAEQTISSLENSVVTKLATKDVS